MRVKLMMPILAAVMTVGSAAAAPEELSEKDRAALLEKLDVIREDNEAKVAARFRAANSAFSKAMSSSSEAVKFYMDCVKKVNFDDKDKPFRDFRAWRDSQDAKLSSPQFRLALRYQLRWFVLTLKAASDEESIPELAGEASRIVADMFSDAEKLQGQIGVLQQGVNGTMFAKAYKLNNIKAKNWPMSPLPMAKVFDQVVLPPLRNPANVGRLHSAWEKRIAYEGQAVKILSATLRKKNEGKSREQKDKEALAYEKFVNERLPELVWEMEVDCFKAGDEREAARRLFRHLTKNLTHTKAPQWETQFRELITPKAAPGEGTPTSREQDGEQVAPTPVTPKVAKKDPQPKTSEPRDEPVFDVPEDGLDPFLVK